MNNRKFLRFERFEDGVGYLVTNFRGGFLGQVRFQEKWCKWVFEPDLAVYSPINFDIRCLQELIFFMRGLKR